MKGQRVNGARKNTNGSQRVVVKDEDAMHERDAISGQKPVQSEHQSPTQKTE